MIRVLAIEDCPNTRCNALVDCCDLRVAHGFDQIKFWLKHHKPQVIILDHDMPGFNGMDAVNAFWEDMICTPVIIWSHNHEAAKKMKEAMEARAAECLLEDEKWAIVVQPFNVGRDAKFYSQFLAFLHLHHGMKNDPPTS
jgi:DNA-binding NarL/FixJ family response regulator